MKRIDINPKDYPRGSVERKSAQLLQNELESEINTLVDTANSHTSLITALVERVQALEGQPNESPSGLPADVNNKSSLIAFAQMSFPDEISVYSDDNRTFARKLRDALAAQYPLIERVNDQEERFGYLAPEEKHSDAFYRVDSGEIIDFMHDSDGAGRPIEKLGYGVNPITPW